MQGCPRVIECAHTAADATMSHNCVVVRRSELARHARVLERLVLMQVDRRARTSSAALSLDSSSMTCAVSSATVHGQRLLPGNACRFPLSSRPGQHPRHPPEQRLGWSRQTSPLSAGRSHTLTSLAGETSSYVSVGRAAADETN
jgi:hypothetical protein